VDLNLDGFGMDALDGGTGNFDEHNRLYWETSKL